MAEDRANRLTVEARGSLNRKLSFHQSIPGAIAPFPAVGKLPIWKLAEAYRKLPGMNFLCTLTRVRDRRPTRQRAGRGAPPGPSRQLAGAVSRMRMIVRTPTFSSRAVRRMPWPADREARIAATFLLSV